MSLHTLVGMRLLSRAHCRRRPCRDARLPSAGSDAADAGSHSGQLFLLLATDNMKLGTASLSGGRRTVDGQRCLRQRTAGLRARSRAGPSRDDPEQVHFRAGYAE